MIKSLKINSVISLIPAFIALTSDDLNFFAKDIKIINNILYVSGLGDGTVLTYNLNEPDLIDIK